jgi:hypothetical protein
MTVALYGLSAVPVAKLLGVSRPARASTLLVGAEPWVIDLARALRQAGVDVVSWASGEDQRHQIERAGLELAPDEALTAAVRERTELEDVSAVLLLTGDDGFNALASTVLAGQSRTPVYRLTPRHGYTAATQQNAGAATLFSPTLTHDDISRRYGSGSRVISEAANGAMPTGSDLLFLIDRRGALRPVTTSDAPTPESGDTVVVLGPS